MKHSTLISFFSEENVAIAIINVAIGAMISSEVCASAGGEPFQLNPMGHGMNNQVEIRFESWVLGREFMM